jgi:hypothetical protein
VTPREFERGHRVAPEEPDSRHPRMLGDGYDGRQWRLIVIDRDQHARSWRLLEAPESLGWNPLPRLDSNQ